MDVIKVVIAELGLRDTTPSTFFHIQSLPVEKAERAFAGICCPAYGFHSQRTEGTLFSDGGQGGWQTMQGNTPAQPLIDAGCNLLIVSHLSNGSLWSRRDFPDATVLEVRPKSALSRDSGPMGDVKDLLGFDERK